MNKNKLKTMTLTGVFTAIVFIFTAYLHIPSHIGYVHIGDGFIYFAACLLPTPYAVFVGAVGALLADGLTGYLIWAPASVIIKALTVFCFSQKGKFMSGRNLFGLLPAGLLCIFGYYLYEALITGSFLAALSCIHMNVIQAVLSSVLFVFLAFTADKLSLKEKIL